MSRLSRALVFALGFLTFGGFGLAFFIRWFGARDRAQPADFLILLGAKVFPDGTPSRVLQGRVLRTVTALKEGLGRRVIVSGGGAPSEASVALSLATAHGAPRSSFLLEERARTTRENARYSIQLLELEGARTANVVSDPFHLFRARQLFRIEGFEVGTLAADPTPMPRADRLYWLLRESLALAVRPGIVFARRPR